jgi:hypothetical protein|tara:strand:+ start:30 stop:779 length:750 start_codon:yes stop_codon:yes gene_type:complete
MATKLYNFGCSFSYGNCAKTKNNLIDKHIGPGTLVAEHLGLQEVNYASNGDSNDGTLRKLYTYPIEPNNVALVGVTGATRFGVVGPEDKPTKHKKVRLKNNITNKMQEFFAKPSKARQRAFTIGPDLPVELDYFTKIKGALAPGNWNKFETFTYRTLLSVVCIQKRLEELGMKYYFYNTIDSQIMEDVFVKELLTLRGNINFNQYFEPNNAIMSWVDVNKDLWIADDDSHPNHYAYSIWFEKFKQWLPN